MTAGVSACGVDEWIQPIIKVDAIPVTRAFVDARTSRARSAADQENVSVIADESLST